MTHSISEKNASRAESAGDDRPMISAAKQQARRLLKISQRGELKVNALNEALAIVARLHGYPDWSTLANSSGKSRREVVAQDAQSQPPVIVINNVNNARDSGDVVGSDPVPPDPRMTERLVIDPNTHIDALHALLGNLAPEGCSNVLTPHFEKLQTKSNNPGVAFVGLDQILATNLLLSPLGSQKLLPIHAHMVSDVLLSVLEDRERQGLADVLRAALHATFEGCSQHRASAVLLASSQDIPEGISKQALSMITKHQPPSFHQAAQLLIGAGLMDDAMAFHVRAMPSLSNLLYKLNSNMFRETIYLSYGEKPGCAAIERLHLLISRWVKMLPTSQPWSLSNKGVAVFQVDPGMVDCAVPATTRWLMSGLLASYRRSSALVLGHLQNMPIHAYGKPQHEQWSQSLPQDTRDVLVGWHKDQARKDIQATGVDFFDEMDGPVHSSIICDFFTRTSCEFRKFPLGVWIAGGSALPDVHNIKAFMGLFQGPPRQLPVSG